MFLAGDKVQITPRSPEAKRFWSFVDGWTGTIEGSMGSRLTVVCNRDDGIKTLYLEPENLTKLWNFGRT